MENICPSSASTIPVEVTCDECHQEQQTQISLSVAEVSEDVFQGEGECMNNVGIIPSRCDHEVQVALRVPKLLRWRTRNTSSEDEDYATISNNSAGAGGDAVDHWMITEVEMQMQKVTEECLKLKEELLSAQEESFNLLVEKENLVEKHSQQVKALQEKLKVTEDDLEEAKNEVSTSDDLIASLRFRLKKVEQDYCEIDDQADELRKESEILASELASCQARLKSKEEEIEVIRIHSEEYLENWIVKEKLALEDKIRQLEENVEVLTQSSLVKTESVKYEDVATNFETVKSAITMSSNFTVDESTQEFSESSDDTKSADGFESLHAEITETQQEVLVPIFGGVGRCDASTQSDLYTDTEQLEKLNVKSLLCEASTQTDLQHQQLETLESAIANSLRVSCEASTQTDLKHEQLELLIDASLENTRSVCEVSTQYDLQYQQLETLQSPTVRSLQIICEASTQTQADLQHEELETLEDAPLKNTKVVCEASTQSDLQFQQPELLDFITLKSSRAAIQRQTFVFGSLMLFICLLIIVLILSSLMISEGGLLSCLDLSTLMAKHGRLEHLDRPII